MAFVGSAPGVKARTGVRGSWCRRWVMAEKSAVAEKGRGTAKDVFLDKLLDIRGPVSPLAESVRESGESALQLATPPGGKTEEWRFTNINELYKQAFATPDSNQAESSTAYFSDEASVRVLFTDGAFNEQLSDNLTSLEGVKIGRLGDFSSDEVERVLGVTMGKITGTEKGGFFAQLNAACSTDVFVISVGDDVVVDKPVQLVFGSSQGPDAEAFVVSHPRIVVLTGRSSSVSVVEHHASASPSFTNVCTSASVGDNSKLNYSVINESKEETYQISTVQLDAGRDSTASLLSVGAGGQFSRTTASVDLVDTGSHGEILGLGLSMDKRIVDLTSDIIHSSPHCTSNQLQKNIATDRSRTIFRGKVVVTREGKGTASEQLCRSLLLSKRATVDAIPSLEIDTDDVQCSHGATVADLEEEQIFYITARGLTVEQARFMLMQSFVEEVLQAVPLSDCKERVVEIVRSIPATLDDDGEKKGRFMSV
ncbi:hypothetical protein NDN08_007918 [Rhodosorus marinus]|uniref:Iron-sulfur cluster assembly SufBD family protein ycf24 n=1 Tax=Rhodosorus marinus TaxID=101924 RepID=A0AAV8UZ92_9RHOD|nr:hypothetical protein NDN08_007918 [Rhodosorus marinus]